MLIFKRNILKLICLFLCLILLLTPVCLATDSIYVWSTETKPLDENKTQTTSTPPATDLKLESR